MGMRWHWDGLDLARLPDEEPAYPVLAARGRYLREPPYASVRPFPPAARIWGSSSRAAPAGHVVVNPWRGYAGIYERGRGAYPDRRRHGSDAP